MSTLPTSEIALAPEFLDDLKQIAPKKKRSKIWILLLVALTGAGAWLGLSAKGRQLVARIRHAPSAPAIATPAPIASDSAATPIVSATSTSTTLIEPAPATASASVTAAATASAAASASAAPSASASAKPWTRRRKH